MLFVLLIIKPYSVDVSESVTNCDRRRDPRRLSFGGDPS